MTALRILVVVALQTAALAYMILDRQAMLNSSRVVTLKAAPVDPRDIFRGDYVVLSYVVSQLDLRQLDGDDEFHAGDTIFVTLQPQGDQWLAVAVARNRPFVVPNGVPLRGTVVSVDASVPALPPDRVRVEYGIESYFVPEGTGREIEEERQRGDLSVDVAVDAHARGAIKALRRKGQVFYAEGIF